MSAIRSRAVGARCGRMLAGLGRGSSAGPREERRTRRLWGEYEVAVRRADRKTVQYSRVGRLLMACETLGHP
ncbi:hypothetical protein [Streptomyces gossypii]|uniref:hypothetical protein n=1 Tax=Streptomyces gossypii TaxID=2883101 RepID=UPI0035CD0EE2